MREHVVVRVAVFILYTKHADVSLIAHTVIKINVPRRLRTASRRCATPGWMVSVSVWVVFWCHLGVDWVVIGYLSACRVRVVTHLDAAHLAELWVCDWGYLVYHRGFKRTGSVGDRL